MSKIIAGCPYCDFETGAHQSKQDAKHERFEHIFSEHEEERSITWHQDVPDVEVIEDG